MINFICSDNQWQKIKTVTLSYYKSLSPWVETEYWIIDTNLITKCLFSLVVGVVKNFTRSAIEIRLQSTTLFNSALYYFLLFLGIKDLVKLSRSVFIVFSSDCIFIKIIIFKKVVYKFTLAKQRRVFSSFWWTMIAHTNCPLTKWGAIHGADFPQLFNLLKTLDIPWDLQRIKPLWQWPRSIFPMHKNCCRVCYRQWCCRLVSWVDGCCGTG